MLSRIGVVLPLTMAMMGGGCGGAEPASDGGRPTPDAAVLVDAGAEDAGEPLDAGAQRDAGTEPDAGPPDGGGAECDPIPAVFDPQIHFPYDAAYDDRERTGGWGAEPERGTLARNWRHQITRDASSNVIQRMTLRYWAFVPENDRRMHLKLNNNGHSISAISISECPGRFDTEQVRCGRANHLTWATGELRSESTCNLEAGRTYYLNQAAFDMTELRATGQYTSIIDCESCVTPYTAERRWDP